jgi:hypothetical protein
VLINNAKDFVPTGAFRQVKDGLEPDPSQVASDESMPSWPTSELVSVNALTTMGSGVVGVVGVVVCEISEAPPPPPHADIKALMNTAKKLG